MELLEHLTQEHRKVERLLDQLGETDPGADRERLIGEVESMLGTHMAVEEQFLYPIVSEVLGSEESHEGVNEHDLAREGLAQMRELSDEPGFAAAVDMVKAGIDHHVEDEEQEMFPKLREKAADRVRALGEPEELEAKVSGDVRGTGRFSGSSSSGSGSGSSGSGDRGPTRDELYEEAKRAGIEGRSKMTKDELAKAVGR